MTTSAPRPLLPPERDVLELLLSADFPGAEALRAQAVTAEVVGHCECPCPTIYLQVAKDTPVADGLPGRVLPVAGQVKAAGDDEAVDRIIVFADGGKLSSLEYAWLESPPAAWPTLDLINVVRR